MNRYLHTFNIAEKVFGFPDYASAKEMENELNAWAKETLGSEGKITIDMKRSITGGRNITIKLNGSVPE